MINADAMASIKQSDYWHMCNDYNFGSMKWRIRPVQTFRFWYQGDVFLIRNGLIKTYMNYFEDWCWLVLRDHSYFSPNTHWLCICPNTDMIDIYLERIEYAED